MGTRADVFPNAKFFRWTVVRKVTSFWVLCKCACGKEKQVRINNLVTGKSRSCGCYKGIKNKENAKHGLANDPIYFPWISMVNRVYGGGESTSKYYASKGVQVCEFLRSSPRNLKLVIGEKPSIKRISVDRYPIHDGNYSCGQCGQCERNKWKKNIRWATPKEQVLNRGCSNTYHTALGRTQTISQWSDETGIGWMTLHGRIKSGWNPDDVVGVPPGLMGNQYQKKKL